jgi:hypothetical protein
MVENARVEGLVVMLVCLAWSFMTLGAVSLTSFSFRRICS